MTYHAASVASDAATFSYRIVATVSRWHRAYRAWHRRRSTIASLQSLGNGTLKDIGIDRSEIESLVHDTSGERVRSYR